ncbi:MAG: WYL domain-containing protein, partial [Lachnospiraceae bacterium]|nr:WYL domain-containing protein [Lachnospiraceae bacterium]
MTFEEGQCVYLISASINEVITSIRVIGESIEAGCKVSFTYKSAANVVVSPYYLVVYGGRYY